MKHLKQITGTVCRQQFVANFVVDDSSVGNKIDAKQLIETMVTRIMIECSFGQSFTAADAAVDFDRFRQSVPKFDQNRRLLLWTLLWPQLIDPVFRLYDKLFGGRQRYFIDSVRKLVEQRRRRQLMATTTTTTADADNDNNKDFLQIFIDYRHNKSITNSSSNSLTVDEIISLFYVSFMSAYEPLTLMLAMSVYELARNPRIQQKLYDELVANSKRSSSIGGGDSGNNGSTDLSDLPYLNAVLMETMRKYPAIVTNRRATQDIHLPDIGVTVPKGTDVELSFISMYYNPQYFPDPLVYNPDRFMPESADKLTRHSFMPFGSGQVLYCVGERFAKLLMKHVLSALVVWLEFRPSATTAAVAAGTEKMSNQFKQFPDLLLPKSVDIEYKFRL
ncbi:probable cytochrome P450 6d5 [Oppia nitens]|uniref:probable cytochrome P450 6d5 n=1 Tax=Oppia nitens TaxID=1686743 RepID=UPI0023DC7F7D|nr:probable cytochrome P450 6d5 [Oppia nitens]